MLLAFLVKAVHFIVCFGLIVIVLLQANKGEGLAGAFGGGASSTIFGERGDGGIMAKFTTGAAIIFMVTSLILSVWLPHWEKASASQVNVIQTSGSTKLPEADAPIAPIAPVTPAPIAAPAPTGK
ncbi:MAG TPA: preprotein translocase subunit SecG [Candidatus Ozemobacteraceae bacterium]|nr:preprotein translocase subunit SecG [Candidatus Ozemobacteraceae bacterium]